MRQLKVRFANQDDKPKMVDWFLRTPEHDLGILGYPTLQALCAYDSEPLAYLPMQRVLMLESTARKPGIGMPESILSLRDLVKGAELVASSHGIREIYFMGTDATLNRVARNHGFEVLPYTALRMKLK